VRAITYHGPRDLRIDQVRDPRIEHPLDALVQVERAAICGSDLHVYHGRETGLDPGTVMGHEFTGRIAEIGRDVRGIAVGDRVVSPFTTSCGACFHCMRGLTARCTAGALFGWVEGGRGLEGAQAEMVRVPLADSTLVRIPDDLPPDAALLLADVLPTGWHGARMADVGPGTVAAVIGCGAVGLTTVAACIERGAGRVFAVDRVPERLAVAERLGATAIADPEAAVAAVREATAGRGADSVIEAVGSAAASTLAFDLVRPGGVVSIVGVHHELRFELSPARAYDLNLTLRTGRCPARALIGEVLPLLRGRPGIAALVTHRHGLSAGVEAYRRFDRHEDGCIKVALDPSA
jgi:threonine dehydrogenase-like Zn-dependent dehydrogenase